MNQTKLERSQWLTRDALLISLSACFADLGYQGVTALYPLFVVFVLKQPIYVFGIITAISFGVGSLFAFIGGKAGDRFDKKKIALAGNLLIPFMSFSALTHSIWLSGILFSLGWFARYFRTPARRALLVEASPAEYRSKTFGFLHALDVGGGLLSALIALTLVALKMPIAHILLLSIVPLLCSSLLLSLIKRDRLYNADGTKAAKTPSELELLLRQNRAIFIAMLISATLFGFSFYNLGFPILTATQLHHSNELYGVLTYVIYLGISALSGYLFGSTNIRPLRALWSLGYLPSALASLAIGLIYMTHIGGLAFYLAIAILGMGMGSTETYEPTLTAALVSSGNLSSGMGWLSVSRSIGQFISNLIMGLLYVNPLHSYLYAFATAMTAAIIMIYAESRSRYSSLMPRSS